MKTILFRCAIASVGGQVELVWRFEQHFDSVHGWHGDMTTEDTTGLIRFVKTPGNVQH